MHKAGIINCNVKPTTWKPILGLGLNPKSPIAALEINDIRVIIDTLDGYNFNMKVNQDENLEILDKLAGNVDYYFKRSFSSMLNKGLINKDKIYPLGLNYDVTCNSNVIDNQLKIKGPDLISEYKRKIVRKLVPDINSYECYPNLGNHNESKIIFMTRLWPDNTSYKRFNIKNKKINQTRVSTLRLCRERFGKQFIGGLYPDKMSLCFPDLVLPKSMTKRNNYLKLMHEADICIATTGLHNSIGWKLTEYVAASKCIVSEPLFYEVPGNFAKGINYMEASTPEEIVEAIETLLNDNTLRNTMKFNNYTYYNNYVRPDVYVLNVFKKVLSPIVFEC